MRKHTTRPPQSSLFLRLVGGGYLVYLAWDLRDAAAEDPLFWIAILVFGGFGLLLLIHAAVKLLRREYAGSGDTAGMKTTEDCEEGSDE